MRTPFLTWLLPLFLVLAGLGASTARAQNSVSAALSADTVEVGEEVDLQITVTGSGDASQPQIPDVPGLNFSFVGQSSQYQLSNFKLTSSLVYRYAVVAERPGDFTIPAVKVTLNGDPFATEPLKLRVRSQPQSSQPGGAGAGGANANGGANAGAYFATVTFPKKEAYVGEALPVEIKLLVDTRIRWELRDQPALTSDGFTASKLKLSRQGTTEQNGRVYDICIFKAILTPVKAGDLNMGPCQFPTVMQLPQAPQQQRRSRRSNSPFDRFFEENGMPDPFGAQNFVTRQVNVTAPAVALRVKPLPTQGQPSDFSGAVGMFHLGAQSSASEAKAGEPITLTATVAGRGNFDRVAAPQLPPTPGWRAYPATGTFKAEDDLAVTGAKTFKIALVPEAGQDRLPGLTFTYFDPEQEKYVTLHTVRTPLAVSGTPTPAPAPALSTPGAAGLAGLAASTPAPAMQDIHYILPDPLWDRQAFTPLYRQPWFIGSQAASVLALLAFAGTQVMRKRRRGGQHDRARALSRKAAQAEAQWRKNGIGRAEFSEAAIAWMAARCEQANRPPADALQLPLPDDDQAALRELRELHDELHYAGTSNRNEPLPPERRARFTRALEAFQKAL